MQLPRNVVGVKEVKVLNAVNVRLERLVNGAENVVGVKEVKVLNAVNVQLEQLVNRDVNGVKALSVVNVRPERVANAVLVDHSSVGAVGRADQVVFCGCSQSWPHWTVMAMVRFPLRKLRVLSPPSRSLIRIRMAS